MDIYKARNLQKMLYKCSNVDFKRMRTCLLDNKMRYIILHCILKEFPVSAFIITDNILNRIKKDMDLGVSVQFEIISKEVNSNIPEGLYSVEIIEAD